MADEYIFSNPILKEIHLSYMRMNVAIDNLFTLFSAFIAKNPINPQKEIPMENKDLDVKFEVPTLDDVRKEYEYRDPILQQEFTEFSYPVMDSEGYIREKYQINVNKSIHKQKNSVSIIESSDLKKIQKDKQKLENRFDDMSRMFMVMMTKMDNMDRKMDQMQKTIDDQNRKLEEKDQIIANLREDMAIIAERDARRIETLENRLAVQDGIIKNNVDMLNKQTLSMEAQETMIRAQNKVIHEQTRKIVHLQNFFGIVEENRLPAGMERRSDNEEYADDNFEHIPLPNEKWIGKKHNPLVGMRDSFSIFTPKSILYNKKLENELRRAANENNLQRMKELLEKDRSIINGRGMPDSLCSLIREFYDKTPIMLAAQKGNIGCVDFLIQNDAQINYLDRDNFTALDYAQQKDHKEIADMLKRSGAVNGTDVMHLLAHKETNDIANTFHVVEPPAVESRNKIPLR